MANDLGATLYPRLLLQDADPASGFVRAWTPAVMPPARIAPSAPLSQPAPAVSSGSEAVAEGLKAGAYYYLVKPFAAETLIAIVGAAIRDHQDYLDLQREVRQASRSMACLDSAAFGFRTTDEARDVATLLAQAAPDPGRVVSSRHRSSPSGSRSG